MCDKFRLDRIYGYAEMQETMRVDGDKLILGGRVISYDKDGNAVKDTQMDHAIFYFSGRGAAR